MINYFKNFFKLLLTLSKILMIILSIDYLVNYKIYSITFNVPQALRVFSIIDKPLSFIESLGMSMVIIPVVTIIISFYFPSKVWLQMLSGVFAIGGNLFSLSHFASKGLLEEYFRTFFLTIYNAPSLEKKISLFSEFFNQSINKYTGVVKDVLDFQTFIQTEFNTNFNMYVKMIKMMTQLDIIPFASSVAENLYKEYNKKFLSIITETNSNVATTSVSSIPFLGYIVGGILVVGVCAFIFFNLYEGAKLLKTLSSEVVDTTRRFSKLVSNTSGVTKDLQTINTSVETLSLEVVKINSNVNNLDASQALLTTIVATNANALNDGLTRLENLYNELKDYVFSSKIENSIVIGEKASGVNIEALVLLQDQIKALASGSVRSNNTISKLATDIKTVQESIATVLTQVKAITIETITSSNLAQSAIVAKSHSALAAADVRWINDARLQLQQFDASITLNNLRSQIGEAVKPIAEQLANKIDTQIQEAKTVILEKKADIANKITKVDKKVDMNSTDIDELKLALQKQIETNQLQTQVNTKLNNDIGQIKQTVDNVKNDVQSLKQIVNSSLEQFQSWYDSLSSQVMQLATKAGKDVIIMSKTAKLIHDDNRKITMGTFDAEKTTSKFIEKHLKP